MDKAKLGSMVLEVARLRGTFKLRSGGTSSEYFDKYRFESDPILLTEIAEHLVDLVPSDIHALAGLELGGVPSPPPCRCAPRCRWSSFASARRTMAHVSSPRAGMCRAGGWPSLRTW